MTLNSKYFQADSPINLHSLETKSARVMKKTDLQWYEWKLSFKKRGNKPRQVNNNLLLISIRRPLGKIVFSPFRKFA
jgi:hypothetical protein